MGNIGQRIKRCAGLVFMAAVLACAGCLSLFMGKGYNASAASPAVAARNANLVVRYALDETNTAEGQTLKATEWDADTQAFVPSSNVATIVNSVNNANAGVVTAVSSGKIGGALSFTGKAHARASFHLPANATGMTISLWVKNITTYWGSLVEFWDGTNGGRLGKGTMQGNGGRSNEGNPWSANSSAHNDATMASGAGWDSFVVTHNNTNGDNGGQAKDNMQADTWYQVTFTVTSTEMKAYRDGVLKQTFSNKNDTPRILQSIMAAAKNQTNGRLGIRLAHDTTDGRADVLDELRIYNGAMSADDVKAVYDEYVDAAQLYDGIPDSYPATGLSYPQEILLDGATQVKDAADGKKTGTTAHGVDYTYTPLTGKATQERDEQGVVITLEKNGNTAEKTIKFSRTLELSAQSLGYKLGTGANVNIPVPDDPAKDIIVKVPADADLSKIAAGEIAAKKFAEDGEDENYGVKFAYDAAAHVATVRFSYIPYGGAEVIYTIRFERSNTATFTSMTVTGGMIKLELTPSSFAAGDVHVPVSDAADFELQISLALAAGATADVKKAYTAADLVNGKIAVTVTNENGETTTYNLVPYANAGAALTALSVQGYTISPAFNKDVTEYAVTIAKGDAAKLLAAVTATAEAGATVKKIYDATEHAVILTVTASNGTSRRYIIAVTEQDPDATLKSLTVGGVSVKDFDPAVTAYTVKYKGEMPAVAAEANSAAAQVTVGEADAEGKVTVTVKAESGATAQYTVALVKMSSAATLTRLKLNGTEVSFTGNTASYALAAGAHAETLSVEAEAAEGATVAWQLAEGNKLELTVTAEDGTSAEYTVNLTAADISFADGVTEDNSPATGGCNAAVGGAGAGMALLVIVGAGLFLCKKRKTH